MRLIESSEAEDYPEIAYSIFERTAELLASSALSAAASAGTDTVYMAGGVSASSFIRKSIAEKLSAAKGTWPEIIFGDPVLSGDNAVGAARLARRIHSR
jgi:tRNA A37 threonylcarbamoyltransferase TsaD